MSLRARLGTLRLLLRRDSWVWLLKLGLSAGMLWFVVNSSGASLSLLQIAEPGVMFLAVILFVIQPLVDVLRWLVILKMLGYAIPFKRVLSYFYIGLFFNQILPASISGDAVRVLYLRTHSVPWLDNILSVVLDRLVGLCGLAILYVAFFGLASHEITDRFDAIAINYAAIVAILVTAVAVIFSRSFASIQRDSQSPEIANGKYEAARGPFDLIVLSWKELPILAGFGMMVHLIGAAGFLLILRSLGQPIPFADVVIVSALVTVVQSIPISLGGWGARELVAVILLQAAGVAANDAFFTSISLGLASLLAALPGIYFWFVTPIRLPLAQVVKGEPPRRSAPG